MIFVFFLGVFGFYGSVSNGVEYDITIVSFGVGIYKGRYWYVLVDRIFVKLGFAFISCSFLVFRVF